MYKKILVTGGAGFIGSNFIRHMMKKNPNVKIVNVDALTYAGNSENLKEVENNPNYTFCKIDITDEEKVEEIFQKENPDAVVHFAAESHVDRSILGPDAFIKTNIFGTHNLLKAALRNGKVRFHHISTDEVFGSLGLKDAPFDESTAYDPKSPYSASKAASDHLVRAYFHTFGLPVTISNCSNNYGPFHFPEKLFPLIITNLLDGKNIPIYGDGKNVRDWLHVLDHARAIESILAKGKIGQTYCVGGNCEKNNLEVAKKILEIMNLKEDRIEYAADRAGHDRRYAINAEKIKKELDWEPEVSFEEGLRETIEWYKNNETWWKKIKSGEYQKYYEENYSKR